MKKASIAMLRANLNKLIEYVQCGKEVEIQRKHITFAKIVPVNKPEKNRTKLGIGSGSAKLNYEPTDPISW